MRLLRTIRRALALAAALAACMLHYARLRLRGPLALERRALWLQSASRGVLRAMGIHCTVQGRPPERGLVVSNHLSYLDILILSSAMPCFFVSKLEVRAWPFFGLAAQLGGTLFLDRTRRSSGNRVAAQMAERFQLAVPLLLFPEGTSTDGARVLPFHARLIEPAILVGAPVAAACVRYRLEEGEERELCWYGDAAFLPHLLKALGVKGFSAEVVFGQPRLYSDRRMAAKASHGEVVAMRSGLASVLAAGEENCA